jgi:CubicO group peptidase (beta-lactamase class C family)
VVLGKVIATRSGMALDAFAEAYLLGPLGIRQSDWRRSPDGQATGGGGLRLRPRDAAKFGALYAAGGTWNGTRVLAADWVAQSRQLNYELDSFGYGLLWWKREFPRNTGPVDSFYTSGNGGNFIFVVPELDLVVVFTGSNYNDHKSDLPLEILRSGVLPFVR